LSIPGKPRTFGTYERSSRSGFLFAFGGQFEVDDGDQHKLATTQRLIAKTIVTMQHPSLVAITKQTVRNRKNRITRSRNVPEIVRHHDLLAFRRRNPRLRFVGEREHVAAVG
jgi:hypothetical protein